jgi:hypothetical protein
MAREVTQHQLTYCLRPYTNRSFKLLKSNLTRLVHIMFIRTSMKRCFRPPILRSRLPLNVSRHFASDFHDRERVEEERISDYDPARYCPIELGSTLEEPDTKELYTTLVKLGFGGTSTTWLCKERK